MASRGEVEKFLQEFREKVNRDGLEVIPTQKNKYALMILDLLPNQRRQIICSLKFENYRKGPFKDRDEGYEDEDLWEFNVQVHGTSVYVKLKLDKVAKYLSFHP